MTALPRGLRALAFLLVTLAVCPAAQANDWKRIRIAAEGSHPPFNYLDDMNQLQGFDVDIAREVCARVRATCEFVAQPFDRLLSGLIAGKYDAAFSSLSITKDREAIVAFSAKYYGTPGMFVVARRDAARPIDPEGMSGLTVGVKSGTVNARFVLEKFVPAGVKLKLYQTTDEARLDLAEGRIDAVFGDKAPLLYWLEKSPAAGCCQVAGEDFVDPAYFGAGIGAAIRKSDAGLKALIDSAIAEMRADGTYDRIRSKYFAYEIY